MREELILEQLKLLRIGQESLKRGQENVRADVKELLAAADEFGTSSGFIMQQAGYLQVSVAQQSARIHRIEDRLDRLERWLHPLFGEWASDDKDIGAGSSASPREN